MAQSWLRRWKKARGAEGFPTSEGRKDGNQQRCAESDSRSPAHAHQDIAKGVCLDAVGVAAAPERIPGEQKCQQDTYRRDGTAQTKREFLLMENRLQPELHLLEAE